MPAAALRNLSYECDHRQVDEALRADGWVPCGAGDWAWALRSPDGSTVARISPFDPTGPYNAQIYREAALTGQVPRLLEHWRLVGGGDLQLLEHLTPVLPSEAEAFLRAIDDRAPAVAELSDVVHRVHAQAREELPWCGPLDSNRRNVMQTADGRLVVIDLLYADGPSLYGLAREDPEAFVTRIPEHERRFMTEIPVAASGPWTAADRETMRLALADADARLQS